MPIYTIPKNKFPISYNQQIDNTIKENVNEESSAKVIESIGINNKGYLSHYIKYISNNTGYWVLNMEGAEENVQ